MLIIIKRKQEILKESVKIIKTILSFTMQITASTK